MYHTLEFTAEFMIDLEVASNQPLERLRLRKGSRLLAQLRPHVEETEWGPVEVADLYFENGTTIRSIPFGGFRFVD
jgi:hypothetical protein